VWHWAHTVCPALFGGIDNLHPRGQQGLGHATLKKPTGAQAPSSSQLTCPFLCPCSICCCATWQPHKALVAAAPLTAPGVKLSQAHGVLLLVSNCHTAPGVKLSQAHGVFPTTESLELCSRPCVREGGGREPIYTGQFAHCASRHLQHRLLACLCTCLWPGSLRTRPCLFTHRKITCDLAAIFAHTA
jgi:hypothetical protein